MAGFVRKRQQSPSLRRLDRWLLCRSSERAVADAIAALRVGEEEARRRLAGVSGRWLVGNVRGSLVQAGWGAEFGYPGLILDPHGPLVEVDVFESSALPQHWHRLDAFEGPGYRRVAADVSTAEGVLPASIYVLAEWTRRA